MRFFCGKGAARAVINHDHLPFHDSANDSLHRSNRYIHCDNAATRTKVIEAQARISSRMF